MLIFALSIFLSAFLLFQVQPMAGKFILPWFGGTPAVWSTAMLFFQAALMGGYSYAYWLMKQRRQSAIHIALLALALAVLTVQALNWESPTLPPMDWKPQNDTLPAPAILKLLILSIGLPYFLLASNGPLMQAWFSRAFPKKPYAKLYSLSNAGSLLGLLAYPLVVEPNFALQRQGWIWSAGFAIFGLLAGWIALQNGRAALPASPTTDPVSRGARPSLALLSLWVGLSGAASLLLLSVTNQISQEVAVIPFLWILPLVLYLLSFILAFSGERGYNRRVYAALFILAAALTVMVLLNATRLHIYWQILAYCFLLFSACMLCHGELYLLRPSADHLTSFYLMISFGGALGGLFVSLIAPLIFDGYWEFFIGLAMAAAVLLTILRPSGKYNPTAWSASGGDGLASPPPTEIAARARFLFFVFVLTTVLLLWVETSFSGSFYAERNFYGVIRVRESLVGEPPRPAYLMAHGITIHGLQFIGKDRNLPTTYYVPESGAGLAILNHPKYGKGMRVGMLGAGVGTLAVYGQRGDAYRLYEINPVVVNLAEGQGGFFSFVNNSQADVTIILGDARLSLERELAEIGSQNFDVLILDTFSSDSIPVHLVTAEAFDLYLAHLAPNGIIAAHITNLHLDLQPVFWRLAKHYGLYMVRVNYAGDANGGYASHWVLLARDPAVLNTPAIQTRAVDLSGYSTTLRLWTDDYSNLFQILK
ncbi:MAG: spermidine synthase [Chloroflexota bacterium]|nr:ferrichrome ABC transporter permease [Chloroflexota bacterium]